MLNLGIAPQYPKHAPASEVLCCMQVQGSSGEGSVVFRVDQQRELGERPVGVLRFPLILCSVAMGAFLVALPPMPFCSYCTSKKMARLSAIRLRSFVCRCAEANEAKLFIICSAFICVNGLTYFLGKGTHGNDDGSNGYYRCLLATFRKQMRTGEAQGPGPESGWSVDGCQI
jgi:hypothetical protein